MKRIASERRFAPVELSVVCAMRNVEHCVEGFLESYRSERTVETQLIVIDGGSTDRTWDLLILNSDILDYAVSEKDSGIYDAWNKALPMCTGKYVSFIGADDRIAAGAIQNIIGASLHFHGEPNIISGFNILTRQGMPVALLGGSYDASRLYQRMMIAQVMSAHRLNWLVAEGGFNTTYKSAGDYELLLRARATARVEVINSVLAYMEDGGISRTALLPFFESYRARRSNGVARWISFVLLVRALMGTLIRKLGLRK